MAVSKNVKITPGSGSLTFRDSNNTNFEYKLTGSLNDQLNVQNQMVIDAGNTTIKVTDSATLNIPTKASSPSSPQGYLYFNTSDNALVVYGGSGAISTQGPKGSKGGLGPLGPGPKGILGPQGLIGNIGTAVPQGAIGPIGTAVPQGAIGAIGVKGGRGILGPQGVIGQIGAIGTAGSTRCYWSYWKYCSTRRYRCYR
jgi:hypothetical protein